MKIQTDEGFGSRVFVGSSNSKQSSAIVPSVIREIEICVSRC
jgi:hypothetical protein